MAHRTEYPPEAALHWTDRQRQVLDLLARGRSNAEIAGDLGVSLAGAKWHVSEVISKLGVGSREEVAEYWREHRSVRARARRQMHGIVGLFSLRLLGGVAAAGAIGGLAVGAVLVSAGGDDDPPLAAAVTATAAPTPTLASMLEVPPVPAPDWYSGPFNPWVAGGPCALGWEEAVGIASLEVSGNEFYFVINPNIDQTGGRWACIHYAPREAIAFDADGNFVESGVRSSGGGSSFSVEPDDPPSCGYSRAPASALPEPPVVLSINCSVPLGVAYAIVDDGTPERVEALNLPSELGFERRAIVAGHRTYGPIVIEFFDADGTLVHTEALSGPYPN
jgi:DNA-binding CsgD family transcriptional regulator